MSDPVSLLVIFNRASDPDACTDCLVWHQQIVWENAVRTLRYCRKHALKNGHRPVVETEKVDSRGHLKNKEEWAEVVRAMQENARKHGQVWPWGDLE